MVPPNRPAGPSRPRGGGIQKRGGGGGRGGRLDRDGDISMDSASTDSISKSGKGSIPSGPRNKSSPRPDNRRNDRLADRVRSYTGPLNKTVKMKVLGLAGSKATNNPDGGEKSLLEFIERKASRDKKVVVKKSALVGDCCYIMVDSDVGPEVLRLNGFQYAGNTLTITETDEAWPQRQRNKNSPAEGQISQDAAETREKIKSVVATRYNEAARLLNLSALGHDPILAGMGTFTAQKMAEKAFKALVIVAADQFQTAEAKKEGVQFLSLANNNLENVAQVFEAAVQFPDLIGLDLSNNKIDKLTKLGRWRHRFRDLQELRLAGNPLIVEDPNYEKEVLEWYPKLLRLDEKQVRTPEQVAELLKAQTPVPIPNVGLDFRDVNGIGETFLREFFARFDSDRPGLLGRYYDEDSFFSLAIISKSEKESPEAILPWKAYIRYSRNIEFLGIRNPENQRRLFRGAASTLEVWNSLPATQHPPLGEVSKWVIDAHVLSGLADPLGVLGGVDGLIICANGEFEELDGATKKVGRRSFTRHFVLGPAKPGRGDIRVISDQLTLRGLQPKAADESESASIPNGITEALQNQMIQELMERTGMTAHYSALCLAGPQANWNFHLALVSFEKLSHTLPLNAFVRPQPPALQLTSTLINQLPPPPPPSNPPFN